MGKSIYLKISFYTTKAVEKAINYKISHKSVATELPDVYKTILYTVVCFVLTDVESGHVLCVE